MTNKERQERVARSIRYHLLTDSGVGITEADAMNAVGQFLDWLVADIEDEIDRRNECRPSKRS